MRTHAEIIELWPDLNSFAADLGVRYVTAQVMKHRGSIHNRHWLAVVAAAKKRRFEGVTLEVLASQNAGPPSAGGRFRKVA